MILGPPAICLWSCVVNPQRWCHFSLYVDQDQGKYGLIKTCTCTCTKQYSLNIIVVYSALKSNESAILGSHTDRLKLEINVGFLVKK